MSHTSLYVRFLQQFHDFYELCYLHPWTFCWKPMRPAFLGLLKVFYWWHDTNYLNSLFTIFQVLNTANTIQIFRQNDFCSNLTSCQFLTTQFETFDSSRALVNIWLNLQKFEFWSICTDRKEFLWYSRGTTLLLEQFYHFSFQKLLVSKYKMPQKCPSYKSRITIFLQICSNIGVFWIKLNKIYLLTEITYRSALNCL